MTESVRDQLIEKSLLGELDETEEAQVQELRREDADFRQEYDFQEKLIQQVRLKRKQELLSMFAQFENEHTEREEKPDSSKIIPLREDSDMPSETPVIPLLQQSWFRVAVVIIAFSLIGAVLWQLSRNDRGPIAEDQDSTKINLPKDTVRDKTSPSPSLRIPEPVGPVSQQKTTIPQLRGAVRLPYYETDNMNFGFGEERPSPDYRTVIFAIGPQPAYQFEDTLKVYLPTLPAAKPAWKLVYNSTLDTYYLQTGKIRYALIKGMEGKQPLLKVK